MHTRWLVTIAARRASSLFYDYETTEIDVHPCEHLNELRTLSDFASVSLVLAMKLHPEDPKTRDSE